MSIHYVPYLKGLGINNPLVKEYGKFRDFYGCEDSSYNFLGYIQHGSKEKIDFIDYSGNNEKSAGLFTKDGLCSEEQVKELKRGFKTAKSPVWHGLISFEEKFGKTYCNSYSKAFELMKKEFTRFLSNARFDVDNIVWCAGFHTNTDHRHIHFSFYEKQPQNSKYKKDDVFFSKGKVGLRAIELMKIRTELCLLETNSKLTGTRKNLTQEFKKEIAKTISKGEVLKEMKRIIVLLPNSGRVSYDSDNMMFLKNKIDNLTDLILKQNPNTNAVFRTFLTLLAEKDKSIRRMCEASKINPEKVVLFEKYKSDLYRRLGNVVIQSIIQTSRDMKKFEYATKNKLALKRIQKKKRQYAMQESLYLSDKVDREAMQYFQEHMKTLEEMRIKVLIEQGIIQD